MEIRAFRPADEPALYEICLRTGDAGEDATGKYADPKLLGHLYVGPYLALEPELAFVLDDGGGTPVGYVLGALDTERFEAACELSWWPELRRRYPAPARPRTADDQLILQLHHPFRQSREITARYPSHLHIDLLPAAQGRGYGRALLERLFEALRAGGSPGVHLGVSSRNQRAIGFYRRVGFEELASFPTHLLMGRSL
ncbi:MAG TPA: GNAT family N-acetyltransferase [Natronosporangium sp.]